MARSVPELWCSVSLCVRPYIEDHSEFQAELLDQWLQLAKAWPLSIVMTFDKDEVLKNDEALENDEASKNDEAFNSQSEECIFSSPFPGPKSSSPEWVTVQTSDHFTCIST